MKFEEAKERYHALKGQCKELIGYAERYQNGSFTDEQKAQFDNLSAEMDSLEEEHGPHIRRLALPVDPVNNPSPYYSSRSDEPTVRLLTADQPLYTGPQTQGGVGIGDIVRGAVTGEWPDGYDINAANEIGTPSLGGHMVPTPLSARMIDLARNRAQVMRAGALTVPMDSSTLKLAKITKDPTGYWRAENTAITESEMSFDAVTLEAKALGALVRCSVELLEDAPNANQVLQSALAAALALELDRVALVGAGTDAEPQGIYGATGVTEIDMGTDGAALDSYAPLSRAVVGAAEANAAAGAFIMAPRTAGEIDLLTATDGQPLQPPPSVAAREMLVTNQVPTDQTHGTATNASTIFTGEWSSLLIGVRTRLMIEASRVAESDAFSKMQVLIRAYLRADVQIARPDHFVTVTGVIPPAAT